MLNPFIGAVSRQGLDLLHMGVVQYSAEGLPMFLHRTDTARLNPSDPVLIHHWRIDYLTGESSQP